MGKGVIDSRHPAWMGTTALSASDYSHEIIRHSDLIVLIGHDVVCCAQQHCPSLR